MKTVTAIEMAELDRRAIEELKIPSLELMENAGKAAAAEAAKMSPGPNILVVCGKGNNGGDGFVAARYLLEKGFKVTVILIGRSSDIKHDPRVNMERLELPVHEALDEKSFELNYEVLKSADLIIDAIFGIGLNAPLIAPYLSIVTLINALNKPVLAVDVPSGLNATTGEAMGAAVKATKTITFAAAKTGLYLASGPELAGEIVVADIGIPV